MSNVPTRSTTQQLGVLAEIEKRMTSRKGKLEAAASLVPCTGSGSLRSYINYVTAESDNFVPDPILDPEKGVEYGIFAEGDDGRELTQQEIDYNEQQAALAKLKKKYGEKEFDKDARMDGNTVVNPVDLEVDTQSSREAHHCSHCGNSFAFKNSLMRHTEKRRCLKESKIKQGGKYCSAVKCSNSAYRRAKFWLISLDYHFTDR